MVLNMEHLKISIKVECLVISITSSDRAGWVQMTIFSIKGVH